MKSAKDAYETWHGEFEVDENTDAPWHRLVKQKLDANRDLSGKRVLEIGCGRGGFSCWLRSQPQQADEIVAVDFAATAVQKGRLYAAQRGLTGITWEVGDIEAINHSDNSFDTIFSCETIEHVPHPRQALRELARVLKPGGRLFLTTPNYMGTMGLYRGYLRMVGRVFTEVGQPINNFMMLPLTRAWVARTGLRVVTVDAVGHYLPFPGRPAIEMPIFNNPRILMRWVGLHSMVLAQKP